jgi:phosphate starvation-inducible PhoH-like protein
MNKHSAYKLALNDHDMLPTIAYGSAGTGKTYGAVEAAVEWLERGRKQKVLICRPNVSFADGNGYLPGTEREKMEPWIRPVQQHFSNFGIRHNHQENLEKNGKLTYMPLEFIQGLTFDNTFIIVDECQNMTFDQIMTFITRVGKWSKVVLCGDIAQVSPKFKNSGLAEFLDMVEYFDMPVHTIHFDRDDILRSDICKRFIIAREEWEKIKHGN